MTPEKDAAAASQREALGAFSSHPDNLLLSADRLALLLNSLIVGTFLLLLYAWLRVQEPNDLPQFLWAFFTGTRGAVILSVVAFALSLTVSVALYSRWILYVSHKHKAAVDDTLGLMQLSPWSVGLALFLIFILPPLLVFLPGVPFEFKILGGFIAVAPLVGLALFLKTNKKKLGFPIAALLALLAAGYLLLFGADFQGALIDYLPSKLAQMFPGLLLPAQFKFALGLLVFPVAIYLLIKLFSWVSFGGFSGLGAFWRRIFSRVAGFFKPESVQPEATPDDIEGLIRGVVDSASLKLSTSYIVALPATLTHPDNRDSRWQYFFGSSVPTVAQSDVLEDYWRLCNRHFPVESNDGARFGTELLVDGPPGSGKTLVLDALALMTPTLLGQASVYLVPNPALADLCERRLLSELECMDLTGVISIGQVRSLKKDDASSGGTATEYPDIVIATPGEWETWAFADRNAKDSEQFALKFSSILLDGWNECSADARASLGFLFAEFKLLQDGLGNPWTLCVGTSELTAPGRRMFYERMFRVSGQANTYSLKPPGHEPVTVLDVESKDLSVEDALMELHKACCGLQCRAVALRPEISSDSAAKQTLAQSGKSVSGLSVYSQPQLWDYEVPGVSRAVLALLKPWRFVVAIVSTDEDSEQAPLIIRMASRKPYLVMPEPITPLLVDGSAVSIANPFQQRVFRNLPRGMPTHPEGWLNLGVYPDSDLAPANQRQDVVLVRELGNPQAVDNVVQSALLDPNEEDLFEPEEVIRLSNGSPPLPAEYGVLRWVKHEKERVAVAETPIHAMNLILLERHTACVDKFEVEAEGGALAVMARFEDLHTNPAYAKHSLTICPKEDDCLSGESTEPLKSGGLKQWSWLEFPHLQDVWVSGRLESIVNEYGEGKVAGVDYRYRANVALLNVQRAAATHDEASFVLLSSNSWMTNGPDFMPMASWAFNLAVERQLFGAGGFGRILVFKSLQAAVTAHVVIVEPVEHGDTLRKGLLRLSQDTAFASKLRSDWLFFLEQLNAGNEEYPSSHFWGVAVEQGASLTDAEAMLFSDLNETPSPST